MIDTDKYGGHTAAPWRIEYGDMEQYGETDTVLSGIEVVALDVMRQDAQLIADAPKLLAEVKRLRNTNAFLKRKQKEHSKALEILSSRGAMSQEESEAWGEEGVLLKSLQYTDKDCNGLERLPAGQYYVVNLKDTDPDLHCFTTWKSLDKFLMDNECSDWLRLSADNEKQAKSFYTERALWYSEYQFMYEWIDDTDPYPKFMKEHGFTADNPELNAWLTRVWSEEE